MSNTGTVLSYTLRKVRDAIYYDFDIPRLPTKNAQKLLLSEVKASGKFKTTRRT